MFRETDKQLVTEEKLPKPCTDTCYCELLKYSTHRFLVSKRKLIYQDTTHYTIWTSILDSVHFITNSETGDRYQGDIFKSQTKGILQGSWS